MVERKKIALTYNYMENWIAGSYYVVNLIKALNHLPDENKPILLILFERKDGINLVKDIQYPYISYVNMDINSLGTVKRIFNKIKCKLTGTHLFFSHRLKNVKHIFEGNEGLSFIKNHYYWAHDFQEFRLPEFFSKEEAEQRSALPRKVSRMKDATLILSSYDALNDFKTFFPDYQCKVRVWRFTSEPPPFASINFNKEKERFGITTPFFICSNQFWQHKNHKAILEAIKILKDKTLTFQVIFTGKNFDFRNPKYFESLKAFIVDNGIEKWTNFVGFIDREVQLCLAQHALSYIQPSFFEGWSTTVEDAKFLNQFILLSDIPVHREQLNYNVSFFNPADPADLAAKMEAVVVKGITKVKKDYNQNILQYGKDVLDTFAE